MAQELIISISGMRGIIGENLLPINAAKYAAAFGTFLKKENNSKHLTVCIGRDSRPSGHMIFSAVASGLTAVGINVIDLGIVTTPGVGVMVTHMQCDGGMIITASHNPIEYNGIKLLTSQGIAPDPEIAAKIRQMYFDNKIEYVDSTKCGKVEVCENTDPVHINKVLTIVDAKKIKSKCFKVILDSVNGAGGRAGKKLLEELGCRIQTINYEPTGFFAHKPEPTKENLVSLSEHVKKGDYDIGFAQDPDADRLAIVDQNGTYIGEEYTLALAAKFMFQNTRNAKAAANLSTSRMIDDIAASAGGSVIRTPVGEANVAKAMKQNDCIIGGEGNGGVIDLRIGPIRNSLVAMAMVLQLMADTDKNISQLLDEIPAYCMIKDKFQVSADQVEPMLAQVKKQFPDAKIDSSDGYRFDFEDGWLHLRSSNTEPIMRAIAEAKNREKAEQYIQAVEKIRTKLFG